MRLDSHEHLTIAIGNWAGQPSDLCNLSIYFTRAPRSTTGVKYQWQPLELMNSEPRNVSCVSELNWTHSLSTPGNLHSHSRSIICRGHFVFSIVKQQSEKLLLKASKSQITFCLSLLGKPREYLSDPIQTQLSPIELSGVCFWVNTLNICLSASLLK